MGQQPQTAGCAKRPRMKRIAAALLMALALPLSSRAELQPVRVLSISNAQQLLVELDGQGRAVRLACLQAPRRSQTPWATRASVAISALVKVGDQALFELRSRDVYGRLVVSRAATSMANYLSAASPEERARYVRAISKAGSDTDSLLQAVFLLEIAHHDGFCHCGIF